MKMTERMMTMKKNIAMSIIKIKIKTEVLGFGFFMLLLLGCQKSNLSGNQIMQKTVETHGGIENWQNAKQFSFDKETTLFYEDGSTELHTEQFQLFRFQPKLFGKIEWERGDDFIQITYENDSITKTINDSLVTSKKELQSARNSFFAALHVIRQPFDLLNDNVQLTLKEDIEHNGRSCYVVEVGYDGDNADADKWSYIIDKESFEVVANKVVLKDHTSWVENLTFDTSTDFKFNAHRKSYRLNEKGEKTYLRAEYFYTNFSVSY